MINIICIVKVIKNEKNVTFYTCLYNNLSYVSILFIFVIQSFASMHISFVVVRNKVKHYVFPQNLYWIRRVAVTPNFYSHFSRCFPSRSIRLRVHRNLCVEHGFRCSTPSQRQCIRASGNTRLKLLSAFSRIHLSVMALRIGDSFT